MLGLLSHAVQAAQLLGVDKLDNGYRIWSDHAVSYRYFYLDAPVRLIVDVHNVEEFETWQPREPYPPGIRDVRLGWQVSGDQRFVFYLDKVRPVNVGMLADTSGRWMLDVRVPVAEAGATPENTATTEPPRAPLVLSVPTMDAPVLHAEGETEEEGVEGASSSLAGGPAPGSSKKRISKLLKSRMDLGYGFDFGFQKYQKSLSKRSRDLGVSNQFGDVDVTFTLSNPGVEVGTELGGMDLNLRMGEQDGDSGVLLRFGGDW